MIYVKKEGRKYPFSRGILAKSISRTGLPPEKVYDIVKSVRRELKEKGKEEVDSLEIQKRVSKELIERNFYDEERFYRISRQIAHLKRPLVVMLGGGTGVGKSTISAEISHRLGIERTISTDAIREIMRYMIPEEFIPILHESSFLADRHLKNPFVKNKLIYAFTQQVNLVNEGISAFIERGIKEGLNTIMNGVHLVPGYVNMNYEKESIFIFHYIIHLKSEEQHKQNFYLRSEGSKRDPERYIKNIQRIREIQEFVSGMARKEDIKVIENSDFDDTVNIILNDIISTLEEKIS